MANNLSNRLAALEKQVKQSNANIHIVFCQGSEPTAEERAEAAQHEHTIFVVCGKNKDRNHDDTENAHRYNGEKEREAASGLHIICKGAEPNDDEQTQIDEAEKCGML